MPSLLIVGVQLTWVNDAATVFPLAMDAHAPRRIDAHHVIRHPHPISVGIFVPETGTSGVPPVQYAALPVPVSPHHGLSRASSESAR
ncbi:MAG: hypothetical protein ACKOXQ_06125 [Hydrogenophaga sp.]